MIISFNGEHGSGKSTIAKMVAEQLGYSRYYMGQIMRDMAAENGMTLAEFRELRRNDHNIDEEVDKYLIKISKEQEKAVIESRTAWYFIPQSFKIYLKVEDVEGAKRIYSEIQSNDVRKKEDTNLCSVEDVLKSERKRREEDNAIYKKYYNIDIHQEKNYDFVLDTTNLSKQEVFEKVMEVIKEKIDN